MLKTLITAALCLTVSSTAFGRAKTTSETIIETVDVVPVNGGINPDAFAYDVTARLLVGGNSCEAQSVKVSLVESRKRGIVSLTPVKVRSGAVRICPRIWMPVYRTVKTTVRGLGSQVADVVILNVGTRGTTTSVSALLADDAEVSLTGYLDQVMAIGGETTGTALVLASGETIEIDLATNNLDRSLASILGTEVTVHGVYKTVTGVEIPTRRVLEVTSLD